MEHKIRRMSCSVVAVAGLVAAVVGCTNSNTMNAGPSAPDVPIIFVHGIYGSGDQYRAQALRFASNGYPADRIKTFEYDSTSNFGIGVPAMLDRYVDQVRTQFHVSKVHLVGHSLGTTVVGNYVGQHGNKVEKYISVDGVGCSARNVPCLAISEFQLPAVGGGTQTHVESSASPESFVKQYNFFLGRNPATSDIVAQPPDQVEIAGKVLEFQKNTALANIPVTVYEVDPATGARVSPTPVGTGTTGADGYFPPIHVTGGKSYEITQTRSGYSGVSRTATFHSYFQPFIRSDYLLHFNTIGPSSAAYRNSYTDTKSADVTIVRNREFWRGKGQQNDGLTVGTTTSDGRSQAPVDAFENVTGNVVGVWLQDDKATTGQSSLKLDSHFSSQPFQTGVDVFMPAAAPTNGTISLVNTPRGDASKDQTINVPNWPSASDPILAEFNDWVQ